MTKTSEVVGVSASLLLFGLSTCFIRNFHCTTKLILTELTMLCNVFKRNQEHFFCLKGLLMLAGTFLIISFKTVILVCCYVMIFLVKTLKMPPSWTSPKTTAIVLSYRGALFWELLLHTILILFSPTCVLYCPHMTE